MARIAEYTNQKNLTSNPYEGTAFSLERYGRIEQQNIEQGSNAVRQVGNTLQAHADRLDVADVSRQAMAASETARQRYADFQLSPGEKDEDAYNKFATEQIDPLFEGLAEKAKTTTGYNHALDLQTKQKETWGNILVADRVRDETNHAVSAVNDTGTELANFASEHPDQVEAQAQTAEFVARSMLPVTHQDEAVRQLRSHIYDAGARSLVAQQMKNPNTTLASIDKTSDVLSKQFQQHTSPGTYDALTTDLTKLRDELPAKQLIAARQAEADAARLEKQQRDGARTDVTQWMLENPNFTYADLQKQAYGRIGDLGGQGVTEVLEAGRADLGYRHGQLTEARAAKRDARADARAEVEANDTHTMSVQNGILSGTVSEDEVYALGRGENAWPAAKVQRFAKLAQDYKKSQDRADGYAGDSKNFHDGWRTKIVGDQGTADDKAAWFDANQQVLDAEHYGRDHNKTPQQMFDPKSPDYIGGPYERAQQATQGTGISKYQSLLDRNAKALGKKPVQVQKQ